MVKEPIAELLCHLRGDRCGVVAEDVDEATAEGVAKVAASGRNAVQVHRSQDMDRLHMLATFRHQLCHVSHVGYAKFA